MKIKDGFILRDVAGSYIVVPVGSQTLDFRCMITLNETGAFLWQQLQQEQETSALVEALLAEYEVEPDVAKADVDRFVESLKEADLLA